MRSPTLFLASIIVSLAETWVRIPDQAYDCFGGRPRNSLAERRQRVMPSVTSSVEGRRKSGAVQTRCSFAVVRGGLSVSASRRA